MASPNRPRERLVALFLLGVFAFTPPMLTVFNLPIRFIGVPALYLYLFAAWLLVIVLAAVAVEWAHLDLDVAESDGLGGGPDETQMGSGA
jgi:hypothetical protein